MSVSQRVSRARIAMAAKLTSCVECGQLVRTSVYPQWGTRELDIFVNDLDAIEKETAIEILGPLAVLRQGFGEGFHKHRCPPDRRGWVGFTEDLDDDDAGAECVPFVRSDGSARDREELPCV
jgi:hypothetical protein